MTDAELETERRRRLVSQYRKTADVSRKAGLSGIADQLESEIAELERPRLGDAIAGMTNALGIKPCGGCKRRQAALNAVDTRKPVLDIIKDVFRAFAS